MFEYLSGLVKAYDPEMKFSSGLVIGGLLAYALVFLIVIGYFVYLIMEWLI